MFTRHWRKVDKMSSDLVCCILRNEAEIEAIADEWRGLYGRHHRTLYSDYDWFHVWWHSLAKTSARNSLHVVIGRQGGRLVAVLPLFVTRRRGLRILQAGGHKAFYCC